MKYKALFLDVDGTLVSRGLKDLPSLKVTNAINKVLNKVHVCLATGRILPQITDIVNHLKLSGLCVISNGIQIYDPKVDKIIKETKLDKQSLPQIYATMKKLGLVVRQFNGVGDALFDGNFDRDDIYSLWADQLSDDRIGTIVKELSKIPKISVHRMASFHKDFLAVEVSHSEASKLHGIVEVSKLLGIHPHEMIGVGDGYNDFPLLMACGLKIAMGNAVPELKAIADFIAPSVEEDGVATVIEKFILNNHV